MSVKARIRKRRVTVWCPACREVEIARGYQADGEVAGAHMVPFVINGGPAGTRAWEFNFDLERPTLSPSLLLTYEFGEPREKYVCHSFVRDGEIQYLSDCTHAMAGITVPLLDVPIVDEHGAAT